MAICDPPYIGADALYFHNNDGDASKTVFDHNRLNEILKKRNNWILFYNHIPTMPYVKLAYASYRYREYESKSTIRSNKKNQNMTNLVIVSNDLADILDSIPTQMELFSKNK